MIPQIKKILYGTDLTKNSSYAFYFATDLARTYNARIIILHSFEPIPPSLYVDPAFNDFFEVFRREQNQKEIDVAKIKDLLQKFCQNTESRIGVPCVDLVSEVIVKEGYPVEEILNTADTKGCDVIVLGSHGKGWLKQAFLGSTASSVLERTRKPVYIIPLPSKRSSMEEIGTL